MLLNKKNTDITMRTKGEESNNSNNKKLFMKHWRETDMLDSQYYVNHPASLLPNPPYIQFQMI